ncbi:hypothetical protein BDN72DRAFT_907384 [Pluteus cervinus]|uniref:Uncharacterized protein n=1 Tax=Pluteus cervinus TaxID=181527 RepID=A0ACD2ZXA8_9AGAR|nr:hypothetical protein BDN72DRAFT_907384 [Pluteus cervinus]
MPNVDINVLSVDQRGKFISVEDQGIPATGILLGGVASCNLVNPVSPPGNQTGVLVKSVSLAPLQADLQDNVNVWACLYGTSSFAGPYDGDTGLWFQTRRVSDTKSLESNISATVNKGKVKGGFVRKLPAAYNPHGRASPNPSLPFDAKIPIYEGRASQGHPFNFTAEDFTNWSSRPLWKEGKEDLTSDNIVVVGYAINTYGPRIQEGSNSSSTSSQLMLSLSIQFVIVLH